MYVRSFVPPATLGDHPLEDLSQEVRVIQRDPLHQLFVQPTMVLGRLSSSWQASNTDHLGGRWSLFPSDPPNYR